MPATNSLLDAARAGDTGAVLALLSGNCKVDRRGAGGETALMAAAQAGHAAVVEALLAAGASPRLRNADGHTALLLAVERDRLDVARRLLQAGDLPGQDHYLALSFAVRFAGPEMTRLVLDAGVRPSARDGGETALLDALLSGKDENAVLLLEAGAEPGARRGSQHSPLVAAVYGNCPRSFDLLLQAGVELKGAVAAAASTHRAELVRRLLAAGAAADDEGTLGPALNCAAESGDAELVRLLLEGGANLTRRGLFGHTPLFSAADGGHGEILRLLLAAGATVGSRCDGETPLQRAAWNGHGEAVRLLLAAGANPNARDRHGATPLLDALQGGHAECVRALLAAGANPNLPMRRAPTEGALAGLAAGSTPLMAAARCGNLAMVELLLAAGAAVEQADEHGNTALHLAAAAGHAAVIERLLSAGAAGSAGEALYGGAVLIRAAAEGDHARVEQCLRHGASPGYREANGWTPLHHAALGGHAPICRALLAAGADPNTATAADTPLRLAIARGHTDAALLLLEAGADPNPAAEPGSVPHERPNTVIPMSASLLADAAGYNQEEVVDALLRAGAAVNAEDGYGHTPLLRAVRAGNLGIARKLLASGAVAREEDAPFLAALEFEEQADTAEFRALVTELETRTGVAPGVHASLPGVTQFLVRPPERASTLVAAGAVHELMAEYHASRMAVDELVTDLQPAAAAARASVVSGGAPHGCGDGHFLLLFPTADPFAVIARMNVRGNEAELTTAQILAWLRELHRQEPFQLREVRFDTVGVQFARPVRDPAGWAPRMYEFCPDLVDQGFGTLRKLETHLRKETRLTFWWD